MKLKIKKVQPSDIGPLSIMASALFNETNPGYPQIDNSEIEKMMFLVLTHMNNPLSLYLIAYDGKQPAGFFIGNIATHAYGKPDTVGVAQELYVVPEKRGGDVGMKLISTAVQYALQAGVQGFEAIGTYGKTDQRWIKLGFEPYVSYMHMDRDTAEKLLVRRKGK